MVVEGEKEKEKEGGKKRTLASIYSFSEAAGVLAEKEKGWYECSDIVYDITHCAVDGDEDASFIASPSSFTQ